MRNAARSPAATRASAAASWLRLAARASIERRRSGQGVEIRTFRTLRRERHPRIVGSFYDRGFPKTGREINMLEVSATAGKPALGIFHHEGRKPLRRRL